MRRFDFDHSTKVLSVLVQVVSCTEPARRLVLLSKGAHEEIAELCSKKLKAQRADFKQRGDDWAFNGTYVLGLAYRYLGPKDFPNAPKAAVDSWRRMPEGDGPDPCRDYLMTLRREALESTGDMVPFGFICFKNELHDDVCDVIAEIKAG